MSRQSSSSHALGPCSANRYQPSVPDVIAVKTDLIKTSKLPLELVDTIIDSAEYWPHITTIRTGNPICVRAGADRENQFIARSFPLGFIPNEKTHSAYQMLSHYEDNFQSLAPQAWGPDRTIPHSATAEVLRAWETTSQPRGEHPCRKIIFTILSHDQGWGGEHQGTYKGSFTWFDAGREELSACREEAWEVAPWPQFRLHEETSTSGLTTKKDPKAASPVPLVCSLRTILPRTITTSPANIEPDGQTETKAEYEFKHELNPTEECLQKNIVANRESKEHKITWSWTDCVDPNSNEVKDLDELGRGRATANGEFVRSMKIGDTATIWAKARFPGWINLVEEVRIDVFWAV